MKGRLELRTAGWVSCMRCALSVVYIYPALEGLHAWSERAVEVSVVLWICI